MLIFYYYVLLNLLRQKFVQVIRLQKNKIEKDLLFCLQVSDFYRVDNETDPDNIEL